MSISSGTVTALACNYDWLSACNNTNAGLYGGTCVYPDYYQYQPQWYPYHYPVVSSPARPIKLTLSEIEKLRKCAKADKSIKDILEKFTSQIEITVDFK